MRVLHLTRDFPPRSNGGLSTAVGGLVRALDGVAVRGGVISFDDWRPRRQRPRAALVPSNPETSEAGSMTQVLRVRDPAEMNAMPSWIERFAPDLVHVHDALLWELAPAHLPRIYSVHVVQRTLRQLRGLSQATRSELAQSRALAEADRVLAPSRSARDEVGVGMVAPLGIEPPPPTSRPSTRGKKILFLGRFADVNGIAELLEAMPMIRTRIILAGGLPDSPKSERRWRRRLDALEAGVRERLEWRGWLSGAELEMTFADAGILVAPSWTETYGQSIVEAMARGLAVVATDIGALRELIEPGREGLLVPVRDPASLAKAVNALASDRGQRHRMGEAGRRRAREELWSSRVHAYITAYRSVLPTQSQPLEGGE